MTTRRTSYRRSTLTKPRLVEEAHGKVTGAPVAPYAWTPEPAWPPSWSPDAPEEPELLDYQEAPAYVVQ